MGERFVGRFAEHIAEVGDRGADFGAGDGTEGEAGDRGRRFIASEPVERTARKASGPRITLVSPALWKLRIASVR